MDLVTLWTCGGSWWYLRPVSWSPSFKCTKIIQNQHWTCEETRHSRGHSPGGEKEMPIPLRDPKLGLKVMLVPSKLGSFPSKKMWIFLYTPKQRGLATIGESMWFCWWKTSQTTTWDIENPVKNEINRSTTYQLVQDFLHWQFWIMQVKVQFWLCIAATQIFSCPAQILSAAAWVVRRFTEFKTWDA